MVLWNEGIRKLIAQVINSYADLGIDPQIKKVPGVFVAEKVVVLNLLGFPPAAACFCGVLEDTQEDMRAGVFTMDLLNSLSPVASENLHSNTFGSCNVHVLQY